MGRPESSAGDSGLEFARGTPGESGFRNDSDGTVRRMEFEIDGLPTFSMAAAESFRGAQIDPPDGDDALIDYAGPPRTVESIPFSDVESGDFEPGTFDGKIAVVGAFAPSLQDRHETSTTGAETMAGPEVHANAIETILEDFPLDEAPGWLDAILIVLLGAAAPLLALRDQRLQGRARDGRAGGALCGRGAAALQRGDDRDRGLPARSRRPFPRS